MEWPQFSNSTNWKSLSFETPENRVRLLKLENHLSCRMNKFCLFYQQVESNYRRTVCDALDAFGHETDIFTHELKVFYGLFQIASMAEGTNRP